MVLCALKVPTYCVIIAENVNSVIHEYINYIFIMLKIILMMYLACNIMTYDIDDDNV